MLNNNNYTYEQYLELLDNIENTILFEKDDHILKALNITHRIIDKIIKYKLLDGGELNVKQ